MTGSIGATPRDPISEPIATRSVLERFEAFVAEHRGRAVGLAWRLLGGDRAAAEDVAQDAFVRAYRGLDRYRGDAALSTWFYRILVNEVRRHRRWLAVRRRFGGLPSASAELPEVASLSERGDPALRRRIADALERLPRGQRESFVLVRLEGHTIAEASRMTGRAAGTIKSHLHRAVRSLRADLGDLRADAAMEEGS